MAQLIPLEKLCHIMQLKNFPFLFMTTLMGQDKTAEGLHEKLLERHTPAQTQTPFVWENNFSPFSLHSAREK